MAGGAAAGVSSLTSVGAVLEAGSVVEDDVPLVVDVVAV